MTAVIREDFGIPLGIGSPKPELSAFDDVVVAGEHGARMAAMVISAHEIGLLVIHKH